jgi:hypothetical protein
MSATKFHIRTKQQARSYDKHKTLEISPVQFMGFCDGRNMANKA